jgi:flagellar biosynthesis/type III secretory pathway chaperone
MTSFKDTVKVLQKNWEVISHDLWETNRKLESLTKKKTNLLSQLDGLLKTFDVLGERPDNIIIPDELEHLPTASIGDVMEKILKESGSLSKSEIVDRLQKLNRLNTKNARIILANAIKLDSRKRFALENGKVSLTNEK